MNIFACPTCSKALELKNSRLRCNECDFVRKKDLLGLFNFGDNSQFKNHFEDFFSENPPSRQSYRRLILERLRTINTPEKDRLASTLFDPTLGGIGLLADSNISAPVLDLGSCWGTFTKFCSAQELSTISISSNYLRLSFLCALNQNTETTQYLRVESPSSIPILEESLSTILIGQTYLQALLSKENPSAIMPFFNQLHRLLKPGGKIILEAPINEYSPISAIDYEVNDELIQKLIGSFSTHSRPLSFSSIQAPLEKTQFERPKIYYPLFRQNSWTHLLSEDSVNNYPFYQRYDNSTIKHSLKNTVFKALQNTNLLQYLPSACYIVAGKHGPDEPDSPQRDSFSGKGNFAVSANDSPPVFRTNSGALVIDGEEKIYKVPVTEKSRESLDQELSIYETLQNSDFDEFLLDEVEKIRDGNLTIYQYSKVENLLPDPGLDFTKLNSALSDYLDVFMQDFEVAPLNESNFFEPSIDFIQESLPGSLSDRTLEYLRSLGSSRLALGRVHGDFWIGNLLLTENTLYVIDWDRSEVNYPKFLDLFQLELTTAFNKKGFTYSEFYEDVVRDTIPDWRYPTMIDTLTGEFSLVDSYFLYLIDQLKKDYEKNNFFQYTNEFDRYLEGLEVILKNAPLT